MPHATFFATYHCSSKFLLALDLIDKIAWGVSKVVQFDAVGVASCLGHSYVIFDGVLNSLESVAELVATATTPLLFRASEGERAPMDARALVLFAVKAYTISNVVNFLLYPATTTVVSAFGFVNVSESFRGSTRGAVKRWTCFLLATYFCPR